MFDAITLQLCLHFWQLLVHCNVPKYDLYEKKKKKKKKEEWTFQLVNFAVSAEHRFQIKETEKLNKYSDFAKDFKKTFGPWRRVIPILSGVIDTILKNLEKRLS